MGEFMLIPLFIGIIFSLVAVSLLYVVARMKRDKLSKKYVKIQGQVVNVRMMRTSDGDLFAPDIKFNLSGTEKIYQPKAFSSGRPPQVGEMIDISVNEENEDDVVIYRAGKSSVEAILTLLGSIFLVVGIICISVALIFK